jgi:chemotaxis protein MotB
MKPMLEDLDSSGQIVWPSFTDVVLNVTLILLFYIFAQAVISSQTSAALLAIQQRQRDLKAEVLAALPDGTRRDVNIFEDGNLLRITFADRVLFDAAQAELKPAGIEVLGAIGGVLQPRLSTFRQIQIEGHTDNIPIKTSRFASNWELSSARATSVVRFLQDQSGIDPSRLSATGHAEYHPVDAGTTDDARAHNRRIEMLVVYSTHEVALK